VKEKVARRSEYSDYPLKPFFKGASEEDFYISENTQWVSQLSYKYDKTLPSTRSAVANQSKTVLSRMVNTQLSMTRAETTEFLSADRKTDNDLIINVRYNRQGSLNNN
jgi:hypothetical protein